MSCFCLTTRNDGFIDYVEYRIGLSQGLSVSRGTTVTNHRRRRFAAIRWSKRYRERLRVLD